MYKKIFLGVFGCLLFWSQVAGFQQQGFVGYEETADGINFSCDQQCIILFDTPGKYDQLHVQGTMQGEGMRAYGFLVGSNFFPLGQASVGTVEETIDLRASPAFAQIPNDQPRLAVVFQGNITATQFAMSASRLSSAQKFTQGIRDFFKNEPLKPYSINLRYGITIIGKPLVKILYRLFIIGVVLILFTKMPSRQKKQAIVYLGVALMLSLGIRNLFNRINRTRTGLVQYTFQSDDQKTFFDLGDYITFTKKIRETLGLDEALGTKECNIYIDTPQDRPFGSHRELVYLKPCERTKEKDKAAYIIVYKKPVETEDQEKSVLLEFNGSFLLAN